MNKKDYSKNKHCKCGELISNYAKKCRKCYWKTLKRKGNPLYKDGKTLKKYYCIDCNKEISINSKRCRKCANSGKNSPSYKHGKYLNCPKCIDCGKEITKQANCCRTCADKRYSKNIQKENHPNWKGGWRNNLPKCIDCSKQLTNYNAKRCKSCAMKHKWKNKDYRKSVIKTFMLARGISPNKPEKALNKLLQQLLPNEYKFVGDGQVIINGFCPDFINCNGQKKIIELFGCYWHKCIKCGFSDRKLQPKDVGRLKTYKKYGYKTLVVWEHELKDINRVREKLFIFNNKGD